MKRLIAVALTGIFLSACGESEAGPTKPRPDLYVAPSGSGDSCRQARPCGTFEAAYRAAKPGDLIAVAPGSYGEQVIPALGKPAPAVEFAATARGVEIGGVEIKADHVVLRGVGKAGYVNVNSGDPADYVEDVRLVDVRAKTHFIQGARGFMWRGGSIGPSHDYKASMISGTPPSYDTTYDRVTWHDATRSDASVHTECLLALGVQGLTIRNSRFTNCAVVDILISRINEDPAPRDILIENTVLEGSIDIGDKPAYHSLMTGADPLDGLTLRNNVWDLALALQGPITNGEIVGNIGRAASCAPGVRYARNVFTDRRCGPTDRVVPSAFTQFVDPREGDWRLKPRAAAIDAADPKAAPRRDAAGRARDERPDAGPFEYRR